MISDKDALQSCISLSEDEKKWFSDERSSSLKFGISSFVSAKLSSPAIRAQFVPSSREFECCNWTNDPLLEVDNSHFGQRLIHRYKNRIAILLTDRCFSYCRHCFRRRFTSHSAGEITKNDIDECCKYISSNDNISEVLLTGGDALVLSTKNLEYIFSSIRKAKSDIIIRLCTRAVFSNPERIDEELLDMLCKYNAWHPVFIMVQFNHPDELCNGVVEKLELIRSRGLTMFNQSVLLKGVNDNKQVLCELSRNLLHHGVKPYYIFLLDKVCGIEHFRVEVQRAMEIERDMRAELSGLEMPQFAIDLPQSGGKIPVAYNYIRKLSSTSAESEFISPDGKIRKY